MIRTFTTFTLMLALASPAWAADEVNVSSGGTLAGKPLALHGYDPVAYFTLGKPTLGSPELSVVHEGAAYYFATEAHKKQFEAAPAKYAPQFGGYCAFGAAMGKKFDGNPTVFLVKNGKLYLNLAPGIAAKFAEDLEGNLTKAHASWPKIRTAAAASL
jgi:YHS domain-containing protein